MSELPKARTSRRLRPLLPAAPAAVNHAPPPSATASTPRSRTRTSVVSIACNACRRVKAKCSGEKPKCVRCVKRGKDCHYTTPLEETNPHTIRRTLTTLTQRTSAYEELMEMLRTLPDREVQDVLQRLRAGHDASTIVNHVKAGDLLLQLSVVPESRFRYEFPYRSTIPPNMVHDNVYLADSLLYEATSLFPTDGTTSSQPSANARSDAYNSLYLKPFHAAQLLEPRLSDAKPSLWTAVSDDDVFMRDLLGLLLRCEYQLAAAFQKDFFLEDMATQRHEFCSSLLVNVVLAYACVCNPRISNRAEYWNPQTFHYRFMAEARRLWELEASEPRITTVQAGIVFSVIHNLCGLDEIGQAYRIHAVSLADKLGLFDSGRPARTERDANGRAYTAWTLYNWESLCAFSFMFPPLLTKPPDWPLPDASENPDWYGQLWLKYPLAQARSPSHFGHVFKARSQFRIIMNDFCQSAFSSGTSVTLDVADELQARLQEWHDNLPEPLLPKTIVLPGHLQLHAYYHHFILTIYEPLLETGPTQSAERVSAIVAAAKKHIQTLIRLYYLRHGFEATDLFLVIPLMLTGYDCIDAISETTPEPELEALRSTLILIAKGLYQQRHNHYLAEALFQVIRGRMRPQEVALLKDSMKLDEEEESGRRELMQAVRSHWPVSVVKKKEDKDAHILKNLVENYARLNIDDTTARQHVHSSTSSDDVCSGNK